MLSVVTKKPKAIWSMMNISTGRRSMVSERDAEMVAIITAKRKMELTP